MHDFAERLNFSHGVEIEDGIRRHLLDMIPGAAKLVEATPDEDRRGTDLWVVRRGLPSLSVDFKHRDVCPVEKWGSDDACVETCSVYRDGRREKPGWSIDQRKRTDILIYTWPAGTARRFWILWFPLFQAAALANWRAWRDEYRERAAQNRGYQTLCVYPPRKVIAAEMQTLAVGFVDAAEAPQ